MAKKDTLIMTTSVKGNSEDVGDYVAGSGIIACRCVFVYIIIVIIVFVAIIFIITE